MITRRINITFLEVLFYGLLRLLVIVFEVIVNLWQAIVLGLLLYLIWLFLSP